MCGSLYKGQEMSEIHAVVMVCRVVGLRTSTDHIVSINR
jgi:hypothetical protein